MNNDQPSDPSEISVAYECDNNNFDALEFNDFICL